MDKKQRMNNAVLTLQSHSPSSSHSQMSLSPEQESRVDPAGSHKQASQFGKPKKLGSHASQLKPRKPDLHEHWPVIMSHCSEEEPS